jgi:hypothetical protein
MRSSRRSRLAAAVVAPLLVLARSGAQESRPLELDADPAWVVLPGRRTPPSLPAAMAAWSGRVFLVSGSAIDEYLPADNTWAAEPVPLPAEVGTGVALAVDPAGALFILRGGKTKDVWRFDVAAKTVTPLPALPRPAGRGGALAFDHDRGRLYAARGDLSRDFLRHDPKKNAWDLLTRVGDQSSLAAMGQSTGALQYSRGMVYAWPDHHVQRYDVENGTWLEHVHMSYGQRPWWDGMAFAPVPGSDTWCVIQGGHSRTLSAFDPIRRIFAFLRPRLPLLHSGEGSRAVVVDVEGTPTLLVYAIAGGNRMLRIPWAGLEPITPESPASDRGSGWITCHEDAGSSLVRRAAVLPVLGIMGKAGARWYFGRLQNLRFFDPARKAWTDYPGAPLGRKFELGLCAAADEEGNVYVLTGSSRNFVRVDQASMQATTLPEPGFDVLLGTQAEFVWGKLIVLAGGERRETWVFDPKRGSWHGGLPLPAEAVPVGREGSALLDAGGALVAVSGRDVWRLARDATSWTSAARLPFSLSPDGGMAAASGTRIVLVEGGGSRRLSALDLASPGEVREHLLPDAVSVAGQRALIDDVGGRACVCVHRGHDTHEIFIRPLDELFRSGAR